jgi:MYXO-CTERM domain-containing protein
MAGRNNAGRPFAQSVLAVLDEKGLDITSSDAIEIALKQLDADGTDSDKDEISDIEELTSNPSSDPSVAGDAGVGQVCIDPEAEYGCGARVAGEAVQGRYAVPVAALLLAAFAFRARRRRTS